MAENDERMSPVEQAGTSRPRAGGRGLRMDEVQKQKIKTPDFRCLGWYQGSGGEPTFVFEVAGQRVELRAARIADAGSILSVIPNAEWLRFCFPAPGKPGRFDTEAAAAFLIRECQVMGRLARESDKDSVSHS